MPTAVFGPAAHTADPSPTAPPWSKMAPTPGALSLFTSLITDSNGQPAPETPAGAAGGGCNVPSHRIVVRAGSARPCASHAGHATPRPKAPAAPSARQRL